jgi:hypothetical protein
MKANLTENVLIVVNPQLMATLPWGVITPLYAVLLVVIARVMALAENRY